MDTILIATGIYEPDIGGPASYIKALLPYLVKQYKRVIVVTYSSVRQYDHDTTTGAKVVRIWRGWPRLIRHIIYMCSVLKYAKIADRIYALSATNAGIASYFAAKLFNKEYLIRIVGDYAWETAMNRNTSYVMLDEFQKQKKYGWIALLYKIQLAITKNAAMVIVPSRYLSGIMTDWGVPESKIKIIANGIHPIPITLNQEEARKNIGVYGTVLLTMGRLVPWKGFRMLIKIMPQLMAINGYTRLVIIGNGPDRIALQSMVQNMGLEKKVFFVTNITNPDQLAPYLAAADLFIQNTGYEGFSHQIVEALSAGVPVITTDVCGNPEIIQQGKNGFLVAYNDEFELLEAIKTIWSMPSLRQQFISEGHKTAAYFNVERMAQATLAILQKQETTT